MSQDYRFITYERLDDGAYRPDHAQPPRRARNAQNRGMLVELNDAFLAAEADDDVRVVILGGNGPMLLRSRPGVECRPAPSTRPGPTSTPASA